MRRVFISLYILCTITVLLTSCSLTNTKKFEGYSDNWIGILTFYPPDNNSTPIHNFTLTYKGKEDITGEISFSYTYGSIKIDSISSMLNKNKELSMNSISSEGDFPSKETKILLIVGWDGKIEEITLTLK